VGIYLAVCPLNISLTNSLRIEINDLGCCKGGAGSTQRIETHQKVGPALAGGQIIYSGNGAKITDHVWGVPELLEAA
jgi:hypothetical protein